MPLMQDEHLIQTLPPDTANEPFHRGILPRTLGSGQHFLDVHVPHTLSKGGAVDAVAIAAQRPGRLVPGEHFDHLLWALLHQSKSNREGLLIIAFS